MEQAAQGKLLIAARCTYTKDRIEHKRLLRDAKEWHGEVFISDQGPQTQSTSRGTHTLLHMTS
jgi:hypothetical protein